MSHHPLRPTGRGTRHTATTPSPLRHASNVSASSSEENVHDSSLDTSHASTFSSAASPDPFQKPLSQKRSIRDTSPTKRSALPDYQYLSNDRSPPPSHRSDRPSLKPLPQGANMMPPTPIGSLIKPSHIKQRSESSNISSYDGASSVSFVEPTRGPQNRLQHSIGLSRSDSRKAPTRPRPSEDSTSSQTRLLDSTELEKLGRSTTGHLRTLSKLTAQGDDTDFKITSREQEVAGIHGRRRLQRNMSARGRKAAPGWGGRTWMDQQRQFLQAYEYLCHIGEAKEWIEDILHRPIPPIVQLEEALRDGVTLAEVVQAIQPDRPVRIFRNARLQFRHSDNIALFFKFLSEVELPELFRFELVDLYEKKNIPKAIYCIHALSWLLFRKGIVDFRIGNLVGQLQFEDHELEEMQKGLDRAGVSMPNFSGMSEKLGAEPEPEPEETEDERVDRELGECEHAVIDFQSQVRGVLLRLQLGDTMQNLWENEDLLVDLQARIRGDFSRQIAQYRQQMKSFAVNLQSQSRGFLVRSREKGKERHWKDREKDIVILQSLVRARAVRAQTQHLRTTFRKHQHGVTSLQAAIRGALQRWDVGDQYAETRNIEPTVVDMQTMIRGALRRIQHQQQRATAKGTESGVVQVQALARAHLARQDYQRKQMLLRKAEANVTQFQSLTRAKQARIHHQAVSAEVNTHNPTLTSLISLARGHLMRREISQIRLSVLTEAKAVIELQAAIRGQQMRWLFSEQLEQLSQQSDAVQNLQSAARAFITRKAFTFDLTQLRTQSIAITTLQSQSRGYLERLRIFNQLCEFSTHEDSFNELQALVRAMLLRTSVADDLERMEAEEGAIERLQASCRGMIVRGQFAEKQRHYHENMKKVVKIQSFIRGRQQGEAYKSLTTGKNPPVGTVKNFVHLLNDSDFDFDEEVESEKLQKTLMQRVQANEQLEQWISDLDAKIGLLAQTKITSDEVAKMRKHYSSFSQGSLDRRGSYRDTFNPKTLNRGARAKLERYGELFYYLQTQPQYLARLFHKSREHGTEPDPKKLESLIMGAFSFASKSREEYFLLKLIACSMKEEIESCANLQEFIRGNFFFGRLFSAYTRVPRDRRYVKLVFGDVFTNSFVKTRDLDLENDPLQIYRALLNDEELRTGRPSDRPSNLSRDQIVKQPDARSHFISHMQDTRQIVEDMLAHLEDKLNHMPFGTRFVIQQMLEMLQSKFHRDDEGHLLAVVGHWLWKNYFRAAFTEPESCGVVESSLEPKQRKNIAEVARLANQMALGRLFSLTSDDVYLQPLNAPLEGYIGRWQAFLCNIVNVPAIESKFDMSEFDDLYAKVKPALYIKMHDVIAVHELVASELSYICVSKEDGIIREILRDLGNPRSNEAELGATSGEVTLTLSGKVHAMQDPDAEIKALFMETKRCVLFIIRVQAGSNLMDVMVKPITAEDEARWESLVHEELAANVRTSRKRTAYTDGPTSNNLVDLASMSYAELKSIALENILRLERAGRLSRHNQYQDLLNAIAVDIRNKHRRRVQRQQELERTRNNISHLESKHTWLEERLKAYNDTFEHNLITLQGKAGKGNSKGKFVMPFSKQWHHNRDLERNGREPRYGSYKRSAEQFREKGILLLWGGLDLRANDLTISSDEINQFHIEGSNGSMMITGASAEFSWDDLLEAEYNGRDTYEFFTGMDGGSSKLGRRGPGTGVLKVDRAAFKAWMSKKFFPGA